MLFPLVLLGHSLWEPSCCASTKLRPHGQATSRFSSQCPAESQPTVRHMSDTFCMTSNCICLRGSQEKPPAAVLSQPPWTVRDIHKNCTRVPPGENQNWKDVDLWQGVRSWWWGPGRAGQQLSGRSWLCGPRGESLPPQGILSLPLRTSNWLNQTDPKYQGWSPLLKVNWL